MGCYILFLLIFILLASDRCTGFDKRNVCSDPAQMRHEHILPGNWILECHEGCTCYRIVSGLLVNCSRAIVSTAQRTQLVSNDFLTTYLDISFNRITAIENGSYLFRNAQDLLYLNLQANRFQEIRNKWFDGLNKLRALCFSKNSIQAIDDAAFVGLKNLEVLDLSHNKLVSLDDNAFSSLLNLTFLDLRANNIAVYLNLLAFINTRSLTILDVSKNRLNAFPLYRYQDWDDNDILLNLKHLAISDNRFVIYDTNQPFENLETLEINNAWILCLQLQNGPFGIYRNLKELVLQKAVISLDRDMLAVSGLGKKHIDLHHCITAIAPGTGITRVTLLGVTDSTTIIFCNYCGWLVEFFDIFGSCSNMLDQLEILYESHGLLNNTIAGIAGLNLHSTFDLSFSIFKNLIHLEELDISGAKGLVLHGETFKNSIQIQRLILNDLNLNINSYVANVLQPLFQLKYLHVSGNSITSVNFSFLPRKLWTRLHELDLSYNPFSCDCDLMWFLRWTNTTNVTIINIKDPYAYTCNLPTDKKGVHILKVNLDACYSTPPDFVLSIIWTSLFIYYTFSLTFSIVHKFRWHVRYWKFKLQNQSRQYREMMGQREFRYDAFVMYSSEDSSWLTQHLLPQLENNTDESLQLCLHERDWLAGALICENIVESIESSHKCLMIVSNAFAKSSWCNYEMMLVESRSIEKDRANSVLVLLEEIAPINMTPRLRLQMQRHTYIEWTENEVGQRLFWTRLRQALKKPQQGLVYEFPSHSEVIELQ